MSILKWVSLEIRFAHFSDYTIAYSIKQQSNLIYIIALDDHEYYFRFIHY